jgi:ceramide glucosyltransferase
MMTTVASVLSLLVAFSLFLALLQAMAQRAVIQSPPPPLPPEFPPVSILKPLKGVDADLKENLRSLYRIDYPDFEVVLGTEDEHDPALALAQRVAAEFPHIRSVILSSSASVGFNPKVNNLSNLVQRAQHPLLLISDSNVRVPQDYLKDLAAHRARAGGGLVWSLFRGVQGRGLGGLLEGVQLNGPVMGGVSALMRFTNRPCCVGKSMLLHRDELESVGGFRFLGQFLAEDQVCAEELDRLGSPVTVSGNLIDNVLGRRTLREFVGRHLRWARLRRHVSFWGYVGEFLLNPVFVSLGALAAARTSDSAVIAGLTLTGMSVMNASTDRVLGLKKPVWTQPLLELALSVLRGVLWIVPFFSSTVVWRGNVLALSARSRIELRDADPAEDHLFDTRERHAPA